MGDMKTLSEALRHRNRRPANLLGEGRIRVFFAPGFHIPGMVFGGARGQRSLGSVKSLYR
jgi:hypothetical protein